MSGGRPDDDEDKDMTTQAHAAGPSLTVAAVARRLGVAPATLRTWDRRYGLGPSEHLAGSHRRYSSADVSRLLVMRRLTLEGVAPSEAARTALETQEGPAADLTAQGAGAEIIDAFADAVPMAADPPALVAAAAQFDNAAVRWMLARVQPRDVLAWWTDLVQPALDALDKRAALESPGEHAAPALVAAAFAELRSRAAVSASRSSEQPGPRDPDAPDTRPVVLAVPTGRTSDLLVHVLATALQESGVRAKVLSGPRTRAVATAVDRVRPAAVLVHVAADGGAADLEAGQTVQAVVDTAPDVPLFLHREGVGQVELPANVHRVRTLTGALHEIVAVVG